MRQFSSYNAANLLTLFLGAKAAAESTWPQQTFRSTSIQAPYLNVTKNGKTELGNLFFSPSSSSMEWSYPAIYSDDGQLVWQGPNANTSAYQPQMLDGEPVLAYWQGANYLGYGFGAISILNASYQEIHRITLPGTDDQHFVTTADPETFPSYIDIHESQITSDGTILVTAVNVTQCDLSPIGGPKDGWVQDGLFYEIDIKTNKVLFRWSTVEHLSEIPLTNTELPLLGSGTSKSDPYEYPHLNSVAKYGDSYLLSSRFMCSIFLLDKHGNVTWHLHGQKGASFTLLPGSSFCYQHDPRFINYSPNATSLTLHLHNNENANVFTSPTTITTGLTLTLDMQNHTATAVRKLWNPDAPLFAVSQGGFQPLPNGHVLLQHGAMPVIEEYDENGALVMTARFGFDESTQSYRGYRFREWVGKPTTRPEAVACREGGSVVVYVSWNGATDVRGWKVRMGSELGVVGDVREKNGFETRIVLDGVVGKDGEKVVVQAVGGVGDGVQSGVVKVGEGCS
ncbi:arylsulfotransferase [Aspergillus luchuensis]|uniref:Arylsulfotransferase n=1 Tax=Aspergillus kawachii TaxID=1069201 RepID=A0A146F5G6_ASPKA|nr:arylsulfotransferase [Aspergillus luchuensis]